MKKRKHAMVRPVRPEDVPQFLKWSLGTANNLFDSDVAKYPTTTVNCAFIPGKVLVYAPIQRPLFLEALAINPEATEMEIAAGLKALTQDAVSQAYRGGHGEIYFLCKDESTIELAKHHYYQELPWKVFRIKVHELETDKNIEIPQGSKQSESSSAEPRESTGESSGHANKVLSDTDAELRAAVCESERDSKLDN